MNVLRHEYMQSLTHLFCLNSMASLDSTTGLPSLDKMQAVKECFGFLLCMWQLKAALTQLKKNDLVTLATPGSRKTHILDTTSLQ